MPDVLYWRPEEENTKEGIISVKRIVWVQQVPPHQVSLGHEKKPTVGSFETLTCSCIYWCCFKLYLCLGRIYFIYVLQTLQLLMLSLAFVLYPIILCEIHLVSRHWAQHYMRLNEVVIVKFNGMWTMCWPFSKDEFYFFLLEFLISSFVKAPLFVLRSPYAP